MRSDTPAASVDILDALLCGPASPAAGPAASAASPGPAPEEAFPGLHSLERLIRRAAGPPPPKKAATPAPRPQAAPLAAPATSPGDAPAVPLRAVSAPPAVATLAAVRPARRKVTHAIAETTCHRLDRARDALEAATRSAAPGPGKKPRVTKAGLVEAALALALDGFEATGPASPLARRLAQAATEASPK
uniref:Uncharacterized protein n=1 Tax=Desulfovibrio sp. U5L TaxID=596152 RepID=I2Q4P4_9BACT